MLESLRWVRSGMTVFIIAIWSIMSFILLFIIPLIIVILRAVFMISLILRFGILICIRNRAFMITILEALLMVILVLISIVSRWMHTGIIVRIVSSSSHIAIFIIIVLIVIMSVVIAITISRRISTFCGIISFIINRSLFRVLSVISRPLISSFGIFFNRYFIFLRVSFVRCSAFWRRNIFFFFWFSRSRSWVIRGAMFINWI